MMKLHAQLYIYECFVFLLKIGGVWCCWWIVDEFIFNWCCCCYEMLLMIETLGNHNHRDVMWICVVLKVLQKLVKWWFVMEWCFGSNFIWIWVPFYVYKSLDKPWEQIWALGIQNWDFRVKMEFYPRADCLSSPWRANWWPRRVKKLSSSPWWVIWWPWRVVQYNNSCFCRFWVFGAALSFLKCFFQHVWSLFLTFNLLEHLMDWDWLDFVNWT